MTPQQFYLQPMKYLLLIGAAAFGLLLVGGCVVGWFMRKAYGDSFSGIGLCLEVGDMRLPFWPMAIIGTLICHGLAMVNHGMLSASVNVQGRLLGTDASGTGCNAKVGNPLVTVGGIDGAVVGAILFVFLFLSARAEACG
jgi:hypothetical protein